MEDANELVERFRQGDQTAAGELFGRYVERLKGLARARLSGRLGRRIDAEDVVQSAYRSFFTAARDGAYHFNEQEDLWRLLAAITINKLRRQIEYHSAGKRSFSLEESATEHQTAIHVTPETLSREPSPEDAVTLVEEVARLMEGLDATQVRMVELRLQGCQIEEISSEVQRSERGVRRVLDRIKGRLRERLEASSSDPF